MPPCSILLYLHLLALPPLSSPLLPHALPELTRRSGGCVTGMGRCGIRESSPRRRARSWGTSRTRCCCPGLGWRRRTTSPAASTRWEASTA
eukprot:483802-Hanusia_phi.AAC.4